MAPPCWRSLLGKTLILSQGDLRLKCQFTLNKRKFTPAVVEAGKIWLGRRDSLTKVVFGAVDNFVVAHQCPPPTLIRNAAWSANVIITWLIQTIWQECQGSGTRLIFWSEISPTHSKCIRAPLLNAHARNVRRLRHTMGGRGGGLGEHVLNFMLMVRLGWVIHTQCREELVNGDFHTAFSIAEWNVLLTQNVAVDKFPKRVKSLKSIAMVVLIILIFSQHNLALIVIISAVWRFCPWFLSFQNLWHCWLARSLCAVRFKTKHYIYMKTPETFHLKNMYIYVSTVFFEYNAFLFRINFGIKTLNKLWIKSYKKLRNGESRKKGNFLPAASARLMWIFSNN